MAGPPQLPSGASSTRRLGPGSVDSESLAAVSRPRCRGPGRPAGNHGMSITDGIMPC
jgi:hypothetical protein